jgi:hypothetical protein
MSKKKGLSVDEKKVRLLDYMQEHKEVYTLKELESSASKAKGIGTDTEDSARSAAALGRSPRRARAESSKRRQRRTPDMRQAKAPRAQQRRGMEHERAALHPQQPRVGLTCRRWSACVCLLLFSIVSKTIQEILGLLIADGLVDSDKIGAGNFFCQ